MALLINNGQRQIRVDLKRLKSCAGKIIKILGLPSDISFSITFADEKSIRSLNSRYFSRNRTTDVIALGYRSRPAAGKRAALRAAGADGVYRDYLGDIIICPAVAARNSKRFASSTFDELLLYMTHGLLHLLGYDDTTSAQSRRMRKIQEDVLCRL